MRSQPTVTAFLDLPVDGGLFFTLNHSTRGVLDDTTYLLAGDLGTDLSAQVYDITISRGRSVELESVGPGTCGLAFRNQTRNLDGLNTAGPYYGFLKPGRPITVDIWGSRIFTGNIDDWQLTYSVKAPPDVVIPCIDGLGLIARQDFDLWTTTAGQTAGPRITDILNRTEVGWAGGRDIGTGVSTLQADQVTWGSNALNYIQLVALSDRGIAFVDRTGTFVFRDRHSLIGVDPVATFADDGTGIPFVAAELSSAGERFFNRVGVDREGGILQTVVDTTFTQQDGYRSLPIRGLLMDSDDQSLQRAIYELALYKEPENRVQSITVNMFRLTPDQQSAVADLDLWDVIHLTWTPYDTGSTIDADWIVEGIRDSIPLYGPHLRQLTLSPAASALAFTLDDPTLGVLDGSGLLAF